MINLVGEPSELCMTIEVTRAETGQVEQYRLVGHNIVYTPEQPAIETEEDQS